MTTVVFVHGTGVRRPQFDRSVQRISSGLSDLDPLVPLVSCYWAEPFGASFRLGGVSIPDGVDARGPGDAERADTDQWAVLELDPLFEVRVLGVAGRQSGPLAPNSVPAGRQVRRAALALLDDTDVRVLVREAGLEDTFGPAVTSVLGSPEAAAALAGGSGTELPAVIARAFVAEAVVRADRAAGELLPLDGDRRDALVALLIVRLGGDIRGMFGRALRVGAQLAAELGATRAVERRRVAISRAAGPAAGDVMVYLTRGAPIREHIMNTVCAVNDDVVLLAHSLGGIACVDLLVSAPPPNVCGVITFGTQVSYLHELGALPSLEPGAALPDTFPVPWVNVFDRRDLLSFLAEPIFGDRVRDIEIDSRAPFPRSHSAYLGNPAFYAVVRHVVAAVRR
jgi:hypothetical protein